MLTLNGYSYPAEIIRVVDGDTINVRVTLADIDLGFGIHLNQTHDIKLRLAGINAPETSTKEGKTAADVLTKWLPVGGTCTVVTVKDRTEKYGRYLAWVYADLDVKDATQDRQKGNDIGITILENIQQHEDRVRKCNLFKLLVV